MAGFYGYDPSKYIRDFSWIGDIGDAVGRAAVKMPELIELNKSINEDDTFQEKTFSAANQWIDAIAKERPEVIDAIATSMGLVKPEDQDQSIERKTELLRGQITQPTLGTKKLNNKEYTMSIAKDFFEPILRGAQSDFGPKVSIGQLMEPLGTGRLAAAVQETGPAKEARAEKQFGERLEQQSQSQIDTQETIRGQKKEEGQESGKIIGESLPQKETQTRIYNQVIEKGGTDDDANAAVSMFNQMKTFALRESSEKIAGKLKTAGIKDLVSLREAAQDNLRQEQGKKKKDSVSINKQKSIIRAVEKRLSKKDTDALTQKDIFEDVAEERQALEQYQAPDKFGPDEKKKKMEVSKQFNIPVEDVVLQKVNGKWLVDTDAMFGTLGSGERPTATPEEKDFKKIAMAKAILSKPDSEQWKAKKEEAAKYLQSIGEM